MYKNLKVQDTQQRDIILHIKDAEVFCRKQLKQRHETLLDIYKTVTTFKKPYDKNTTRATRFVVNKSHEVINKVLPKVIARNPKWIVSRRAERFDEEDKNLSEEELLAKEEMLENVTDVIQDYLTYTFDKYSLAKIAKLWAKKDITYWDAFAKVEYKYEIGRTPESIEDVEIDDNWEEIKSYKTKVKEDVIAEYPTMVIPSRTDILYDPSYIFVEDMPYIIEVKEGVRMSYFTKNRKKYFNIDELIKLWSCTDERTYKNMVFAVSGITLDSAELMNKNNLMVKYYYGLYEMDTEWHWEWEKLYEFCVVNDVLLVWAREIAYIPFEQIKCFDDPETNFWVWFVEPIISLQDELNFKKNNAAEYILKSSYRSFIWNPNSWISPKQLIDKPNNIIVTDRDRTNVEANLWELPQRSIDPSYFNEQNDFERQIQALTFTVDTSNSRSDQALTNTATGIKVKYYENNAVIDEVRKSFEAWIERIAYKILQCAYDNMTDNVVIERSGDGGFWEAHKEIFRDAIRRYNIKIETGSSSYDSVEQRKWDAIERWQVWITAKQLWLPVNLLEHYKDLLETQERPDVDRFIEKNPAPQQMMGMQEWRPQDIQTQKPSYDSMESLWPIAQV